MKRDFASLLDELIAEREESSAAGPNLAVDCLAVLDELEVGRARFSEDEAVAGYRDAVFEDTVMDELAHAAERMLAPVDAEAIARELRIAEAHTLQELDALRRVFALHNHPDRVEPALRDTAMQRMQIANMLIDAAKQRCVSAVAPAARPQA